MEWIKSMPTTEIFSKLYDTKLTDEQKTYIHEIHRRLLLASDKIDFLISK